MGRCGDAFETAPWQLNFPSQEVRARVLPADFVRGIPGVVSSAGGRDGAGQEGRASQGQPAAGAGALPATGTHATHFRFCQCSLNQVLCWSQEELEFDESGASPPAGKLANTSPHSAHRVAVRGSGRGAAAERLHHARVTRPERLQQVGAARHGDADQGHQQAQRPSWRHFKVEARAAAVQSVTRRDRSVPLRSYLEN